MSDKTQLQEHNVDLSTILSKIGDLPLKALVEAAARQGQYVWKKLTAEGGTFVDYIVNDSETAYPDGGMKEGYWYERVVEGVDLLGILGYTKMAVDECTFSSDTSSRAGFSHSLGILPKFAMVLRDTTVIKPNSIIMQASIAMTTPYPIAQLYEKSDSTSNKRVAGWGAGTGTVFTADYVMMVVSDSNGLYAAGVKYTLITMA